MPLNRYFPLLAAFLTIVLWAFAFPASKAVLPYYTVEQAVLLRYLVACLFYILLFAFGQFPLPRLRDVPVIFILGVLGITIYQLLFVFGVGKVAAGAASMIITANPVFASLLARFFLGEKLSNTAWTGIALSLIGVSIIAFIKGTDGTPIGFIAMLVSCLIIAVYFVFQKPFFKRYSPLSMTSYTSIAGTIPLLIFLPETIAATETAPASAILWIVIMGVFSSGIGFLLWFYALSRLRAGIVTSFLFLQPVFVVIMSWIWLNEIPGLKTFIGGAVILLGLLFILKEQIGNTKNSSG